MTLTVAEVPEVNAATRADLARIHEQSAVRAYAHIVDTPFPREETLQRWASYRGHVGLARHHGETIGFVAWHDDELDALYVLPQAAGTGAGTALMRLAAGTTRLWVLAENDHARAFYAARGWRPSGRTRTVYAGVIEQEYVRDLAPRPPATSATGIGPAAR